MSLRLSNYLSGSLLLIFLLVLCFIVQNSRAQEQQSAAKSRSRLELLHADVSRGVVEGNVPLKILEGNVHARQDSLELYCRRAVYNKDQNKITLTGDVKLIRGRDTLTARHLTYFEKTKIAIADKEVEVRRPGQALRSDYLEYHYENDRILAVGSLWLHDADNRVFITAYQGEYLPEQKKTYVETRAHLWQIDSTATDTLHIHSHRMDYLFGEQKQAIALDSVRILQGALEARCDSAIYLVDEEVAYLEKNPSAVQENNEMFGQKMQLIMKDMKLTQIRVEGGAQAISKVDSLGEKENRLEGREIVMYISKNKLDEVWAISNARSRYFIKEQEEGRGLNVASADTIRAFFKSNELDSIAVIGGAQGTYYPEDYKGPIVQE